MQAIQVRTQHTAPSLIWSEVPDPPYGPDDVLVDIHATALNRADLSQVAGNYPPPPGAPDILGLEMAGVIAAVGANVTGWRVGDRVCALLPGGGYAERVAVPAAMLMPIPPGWSFEQAAALPEVYLTVFVNLYMEAGLQPGETVLVHGGSSGVGTAAIQLTRASGNPILVTAGSAEKVAACQALGADLAINYKTEDFVARVHEHLLGQGVDVILDMVGASYLARNLELLKLRGRLVFIATLGGSRAEIDIGTLMRRRARLIGSVLRSRPLDEKVAITQAFRTRFWPQVESGTITPVVDAVYPIAEAGAALARMAGYQNIGKIVLRVRNAD